MANETYDDCDALGGPKLVYIEFHDGSRYTVRRGLDRATAGSVRRKLNRLIEEGEAHVADEARFEQESEDWADSVAARR